MRKQYQAACPGHAEGVIDAHRLSGVVESIGLLRTSSALSKREHAALERWFRRTGDVDQPARSASKSARRATTTACTTTSSSPLRLVRAWMRKRAEVTDRARELRIDTQIATDGSLPLEGSPARAHCITSPGL